jgi:predicted nucleic acid-binding protein
VAVVVFDADVLIAYLGREDAHHAEAIDRMRRALEAGTRRLVCVVNYTEVLVGPLAVAGAAGAATVDAMFRRLAIELIQVDPALARRAAAVRVETKLELPDAYVIATAIDAVDNGRQNVRIESFDKRVVNANLESVSRSSRTPT